jgi:hypothetical protein
MVDSELSKNMKIGLLLIATVLVFASGYYFSEVDDDFDLECSSCTTIECMDNDIKCGDFGEYYFKFATLLMMGLMGMSIYLFPKIEERLNG